MNRKNITAHVYATENETVRLSIPEELYSAKARAEIVTGERLCGYHTGRKWGILHIYNICPKGCNSGEVYGDEYTAYRMDDPISLTAYKRIICNYNPYYYEF